MSIEARLTALGITLPSPLRAPANGRFPFPWVRVIGTRALISGHAPTNADGSIAQPLGKVGADLTVEQGYAAARLTALAILASLKQELGTLDRVAQWVRILGMVNSAPGFGQQPAVINGFTDLIVEVWGAQAGSHARSAVGMAELPFGIPVEIEGEVLITA
jgi:enamine deaminase RidA (YjgF/YER057c/UK114 family)